MIYVRYNEEESFVGVQFKRISDHVVGIIGNPEIHTNGFKTFATTGTMLGDFSDYRTIFAITEGEIQYSNDGSVYEPPKEEDRYIPREPTPDEIKQMLIDGVQNWMDEIAMSRGYDSILSACSYIKTGVERFDTEGQQAREWRSQVWIYCYNYLDEVLAGNRSIPTLEELIEELPKIDWLTE